MNTPPVLIVGAGPTGLMLALRLARHGVDCRIIDKNSGPGQASRAMAVHARTLEFYQQLGFADELVSLGIKINAMHIHEGGEELVKLALGEIGEGLSPYPFVLSLPQDEHERFLISKLAAAGVHVEWNVALDLWTQDDSEVQAILLNHGERQYCTFNYICGCDGARSKVREIAGFDFSGGTYDHLYYVADAKVAGKNTDLHAHLGANSFALMLPVRTSGMQRLIGILPDRPEGAPAPVFDDVREQVESLLNIQVEHVNWFSTYKVHHRVAAQFRERRCFILGDAAHLHSPVGGQGMNTGLGDAVNLAWKLAQKLRGQSNDALLDTYESERIVFARKLVATTDRAFQAIVAQGMAGQFLRRWLVPHALPFLSGFARARRLLFQTVSQIQIHYEDSALSAGHAEYLRGGDRLPWFSDGTQDNFTALRSMDWQLHIYGEAAPELLDEARVLKLPVHCYTYNVAAKLAGLGRDAAYLVRPDGHIALALHLQESGALRALALRLGLHFGPAESGKAAPRPV